MARWQDVNGIYQIYPRSFKDSNGDGVGDLVGITQQLEYIKGGPDSLGIDAVWISPFYRSPMADFGYDVSDYYSVDPQFGDLEDFKLFVTEAHNREIKVMIDFVPNHTSSEHPWFVAAKSSKDNPKRDWYIWRDPKADGSPPNNWLSVFGGSAWEFDKASGQYYLHSFLAKQPDLNWENPEVREVMAEVLDFWLALGVDGIRADAVRWIAKDPEFRDNPLNPQYIKGTDPYHTQIQRYSRYGVNLPAHLRVMTNVIETYPNRIILFEDYIDTDIDASKQYAEFYSVNPKVAAPFNFEGINTSYDAEAFRTHINWFQKFAGSDLRPFYCFGNHDTPRLVSRVGIQQARLLGLMQLTLPGIPVVYYGEEIGMRDVGMEKKDIHDPFEKQVPAHGLGRDPERTPMQWKKDANAGFTTGKPWLPIAFTARKINVETELEDAHSFLAMYRTLLELRRSSAIRLGKYVEWSGSCETVFGFSRKSEFDTLLILLNMSDEPSTCEHDVDGEILYSTHEVNDIIIDTVITLAPHQGVVIRRHRG